ncbi:MAG: FAD-dependent oxidoreductase [Desulfobacteraceae bacterium]|nr:FAD-dependent oxidoreductase [Desulfobacteraceae bacterium]
MKTDKRSIGIVGGGLLGMTLALRLSERGFHVSLIEGAIKTGGLASSWEIGDYTWDKFYHVILLSDKNLLNLLKGLGLMDQINWGQTKTGFLTDGHLYSMSDIMEFLTFPPLNTMDKLRLGLTVFYASKIKSWECLEKISATEWLTRLSGKRTFNKVWLPLLKSKLGDNYKLASASFIWAIIARMYAARRSGLKKEMFGYVNGGYATILDCLQRCLDNVGVETICQTSVEKVSNATGGVELETNKGRSLKFDKVILTIPCTDMPKLCPQLSTSEKQVLNRVTYQGVLCASLILRKPLAGYYITNITDEWVPFTGVIEMTALVDKENFSGNSLVYLPRYLAQEDPFWNKSNEEIQDEFLNALELMYPSFRRGDVLAFKTTRANHVLPIKTLNYSIKLLPPTRTSLENVFVVNSAQIPNGTMNVNEIVGLANRKVQEIVYLSH